jgi:hypothetical protein
LRATRDAHANEVETLKGEHQNALAEAESRRVGEIKAADEDRRDQLAGQRARHDQAVAELKAAHDQSVADKQGEHDAAVKALRDSHAQKVTELVAVVQQHADAHQSTQGELEKTRARLAEVERENVAFQDQILRAYQKIKGDQALGEKLRRALGVAVTLLDEQNRTNSELQKTDGLTQ